MMVGLPAGEVDNCRFEQGSTVALPLVVGAERAAVVAVTSSEGRATGVLVGKGVNVGMSVGGSGVAVGMAACVCATTVKAAATAVDCTASALMVGAACGAQ